MPRILTGCDRRAGARLGEIAQDAVAEPVPTQHHAVAQTAWSLLGIHAGVEHLARLGRGAVRAHDQPEDDHERRRKETCPAWNRSPAQPGDPERAGGEDQDGEQEHVAEVVGLHPAVVAPTEPAEKETCPMEAQAPGAAAEPLRKARRRRLELVPERELPGGLRATDAVERLGAGGGERAAPVGAALAAQ